MEDLTRLSQMSPDQPLIESYLRVGRMLQARGLAGVLAGHGMTAPRIPTPAEAHNKHGLFYASLGTRMREPALFDLSVDAFQAALQLEPQAYEFINNLANAYFEQGLLNRAAEAYGRALRMNPELAETRANLGLLYERQGELDLAAQEYQTALKLRPNWERMRLSLQRIGVRATLKE
jgi:tetratricopeptide (TPR) repeat protein